jgi:hypothetical protein
MKTTVSSTDKEKTMTATKTRRPAAPVVTKKTAPSKPGEKVDVNAAKVIPPSAEVRVAEDAAKSKATAKATVSKATAKMTKGGTKDGERVSVKGNPLTKAWLDKKGVDVKKGDVVKMNDGNVGTVQSRFTMPRTNGDRVPSIAVKVEGRAKGVHVPANTVVRTKAAA